MVKSVYDFRSMKRLLPRTQTPLSCLGTWARKGGREGERKRESSLSFSFPLSLALRARHQSPRKLCSRFVTAKIEAPEEEAETTRSISTPHLDRMQSISGLLPALNSFKNTWVERGTMKVKCLAQEHNNDLMTTARTRLQ